MIFQTLSLISMTDLSAYTYVVSFFSACTQLARALSVFWLKLAEQEVGPPLRSWPMEPVAYWLVSLFLYFIWNVADQSTASRHLLFTKFLKYKIIKRRFRILHDYVAASALFGCPEVLCSSSHGWHARYPWVRRHFRAFMSSKPSNTSNEGHRSWSN